MNKLPVAILLTCVACTVSAAEHSALPKAPELLRDIQARFPRDSISIIGDLEVRKRKGEVIGSLNVEIFLDLGNRPALARYALRDAFGNDLEELTVIRSDEGEPRLDYRSGNPLTRAELPGMFQPIRGTDLSWTDLTLAFLRWRGGQTVGRDTFKGQACLLVDVPAPPESEGAALRRYAKVRLWIHERLRMIVKAEAYDEEGGLVRRLEIKSLRKIDDRWMIKDMEVESFPPAHKTRFRVREVRGDFMYDGDSDS